MINYETLLSAYDDKLTLMQWLKKVEAALKDASAVSFNVNKRGDATLTFSVVFEDGSELETAPIVLQQGESVTGAHMDAGHLILTLSNGDELDAGNLGAVSGMFINASQHLIVTYQDGTTQDLGAIFAGDVVINGNFEVTGRAKLPIIEGGASGHVTIDDDVIINDSDLTLTDGKLSTPILTSAGAEIEAEKPVVEVMTGYSFIAGSSSSHSYVTNYASVCKNGNKLTFVVDLTSERTASGDDNMQFASFIVPYDIAALLYPVRIGPLDILDARKVSMFASVSSVIDKVMYVAKSTNRLNFVVLTNGDDTQGAIYHIRAEVTFLLSDNLAA